MLLRKGAVSMDYRVKDRVFKIREIRNNTETLKWFEDYINKSVLFYYLF